MPIEYLSPTKARRLRMLKRSLCLAILLAGGTAVAQTTTTLYKSTGPDGKTIYSDRPPVAQEAKTLTFQSEPASPLSAETLAYIEQLKKSAHARATAPPPSSREAVLYMAAWCGYCKKAKAYLAARQVAYREYDIDTKDGLLAFARADGKRGVPLLVVDGRSVSGFSTASYDAILGGRK